MRSTPVVVWSSQALPASGVVRSAQPLSIVQSFGYAVQIVWTGSPVGDFSIEGSCDNGTIHQSGIVTGVTNWTVITGSVTAAGGVAGSLLYNVADANYQWFRVVYTATSGTGVANAMASIKGI